MSFPMFELPVEIRNKIYRFAAERDEAPAVLLQRWFEKVDPNPNREEDEAEDGDDDAIESDDDGEEEDEVMEDEDMEDEAEEGEDEEYEPEEEEDEEDGDAEGEEDNGPVAIVPPPYSVYRYALHTLDLAAHPPPVPLLLTCKTVCREATDEYYNRAALLHINATCDFQHITFYEDILQLLARSPYSPLERIRKIDLTLAYDSKWVNATPGVNACVFDSMFNTRAKALWEALALAPQLERLTLRYYDTEFSESSMTLQINALTGLHVLSSRLPALKEVDVQEHILDDAVAVEEGTVHGMVRREFERILADGQNFY